MTPRQGREGESPSREQLEAAELYERAMGVLGAQIAALSGRIAQLERNGDDEAKGQALEERSGLARLRRTLDMDDAEAIDRILS